WTPWEKIDADIEGEHLVPVIFQRRLHLFWTAFREANKEMPALGAPKESEKKPPAKLGKDWEVSIAYTVYDRGRASRKPMATGGVPNEMWMHTTRKDADDKDVEEINGSTAPRPGDYALRATVSGNPARLHLHVYRRRVNGLRTAQSNTLVLEDVHVDLVARF